MSDPVRIGVMGCANIARRRMMPAMVAGSETELVAVASQDPAKAAEVTERFGGRAVSGYTALLELDEVEAVYIPLPAALHAEWIEAALSAGKHVLAEKPVTLEPELTRKLLALAQANGLVLMENVMFVHHSQHAAVRRLLEEGGIGELWAFHAAFTVPELPPDDIRYSRELGGGAIWDVGIYPVRASLEYLGDTVAVAGAVLASGPGKEVDTVGAALLRTETGVGANLTFGLQHVYSSCYALWGSTGRITVDRAFTPPPDHVPVLRLERRTGTEEIRLAPDDQVANTVRAFAGAVRTSPEARMAFAGERTVRQVELLDEIHRFA